tara:strand:- start:1957 stop:3666 length:1710 start_codon:yes stop_codon:yes gene_type:complete
MNMQIFFLASILFHNIFYTWTMGYSLRRAFSFFGCIGIILAVYDVVHAQQDSRILSLYDRQSYEYIKQLQDRGYLLELHPTDMPYRYDELHAALEDVAEHEFTEFEAIWIDFLLDRTGRDASERPVLDLRGASYLQANNSERDHMYRPSDDILYLWPMIELAPGIRYKGGVIQANARLEYYEDRNIDGLDAVRRFYVRNEETYLGFSNEFLEVYGGRVLNHWGVYRQSSGLLSDQSVTYDQLKINISTKHLQLSSVMGYLDNLNSDNVFNGDTRFDPSSVKRYLFAKRLDWRPREHLMFSYRESLIFSGWTAVPQPKYMLPGYIGFFQADNAPANDFINFMTGIAFWGQFWGGHSDASFGSQSNLQFDAQTRNILTIHTEVIIDDIIFNRKRRGIDELSIFNVFFNATYTTRQHPLKLQINAEMVGAQSYNTGQAHGRYLYLGRGIATQFNDYVFGEFRVDLFMGGLLKGLKLSPYLGGLLQGEQIIDKDFDSSIPDFVLSGVVQESFRAGAEWVYYSHEALAWNKGWWIRGDFGLNLMRNLLNLRDNNQLRLVGMIEFGVRFDFSIID